MYKILKMEGRAKRAHMETVHGNIETPVFMNVGTAAAIKGAVSTEDLQQIGTQVELSNTYHLHVRPGDEVVKKMGEDTKVAVRNLRRDANDKVKKMEKAGDFTEDDAKGTLDDIQKLIDKTIKDIDKIVEEKEQEILEV